MTTPFKIKRMRDSSRSSSKKSEAPLVNDADDNSIANQAILHWGELPYKERSPKLGYKSGRIDAQFRFIDIHQAIDIACNAVVESSNMFYHKPKGKVVREMIVFDPDHGIDYPRMHFITDARQIFSAIMLHLYGIGRDDIATITGMHRTTVNHATDAVSDYVVGARLRQLCILYHAHQLCVERTEKLFNVKYHAGPSNADGDHPADTDGQASDDTEKLVHEPVSQEVLQVEGRLTRATASRFSVPYVPDDRVSYADVKVLEREEAGGDSRDATHDDTGHRQLPEGADGRAVHGGLPHNSGVSEQVVGERPGGRGGEDSDTPSTPARNHERSEGERRRSSKKVPRKRKAGENTERSDTANPDTIFGRMSEYGEEIHELMIEWTGGPTKTYMSSGSDSGGIRSRMQDRKRNGSPYLL